MQSIAGAQSRLAGLASLLFAQSSKRKNSRRSAGTHASGRGGLQRKTLRIERPGFSDKFRRGQAPMRWAIGLLAGFYLFIGFIGVVLGDYGTTIGQNIRGSVADAARYIGFGINEVRVVGGTRLTNGEIARLLSLNDGASAFTLDVNAARARILEIPWIKSADVRLLMPGTLEVAITEREPYALWQRAGKVMMIDKDGHEIGPYVDTRFSSLPLVVGDGADKQARQLFDQLQQYPALAARTRAAIYVASRRWNLKFTDGIDVKLPEHNFEGALQTLADLDKDKGLLNRDITDVDLRLPDRVIVRLTESAAAERAEMLKARAKGVGAPPLAVPPARKPA